MLNMQTFTKNISKYLRRVSKSCRYIVTTMQEKFLRSWWQWKHKSRLSTSGFVLPTVAMVTLVVVLLSAAIVTRSFDRAKNISNYRVSQQSMNAALPALDRAKAKIAALLEDPNLPRGTPSDVAINDVLERDKYSLGDEERLHLEFEFNNESGIQTVEDDDVPLEQEEITTNAWRFPVDTDNNGKFDSYTLYSILFRSPPSDSKGSTRQRNPLDARSRPMSGGENKSCASADGTSASLVDINGWLNMDGVLKKSFFTYVATVPITDLPSDLKNDENYEEYTGNQSFSALEYQQDQARVPLANNAIVYEDDLDISAGGGGLNINGRIFTNSNLFYSARQNNPIQFRQVSSPESCFYEAENAKIVVGGDLSYGKPNEPVTGRLDQVQLDLFRVGNNGNVEPNTVVLSAANNSLTAKSKEIAFNNRAYEERIAVLVKEALARDSSTTFNTYFNSKIDPAEVRERIQDSLSGPNPPNNLQKARAQELDTYFRKRTRRVSFIEVPYVRNLQNPEDADPSLSGSKHWQITDGNPDSLRPENDWMYPFRPTDGETSNASSSLKLNVKGKTLEPKATEFDTQEATGKENFIGDRILLGNNLPEIWWDPQASAFVGQDGLQDIDSKEWNEPVGKSPRSRKTRVRELDDVGDIDRDGFWETQTAEVPTNSLDAVGGLRAITGAGLYLPPKSTDFANASQIIWSDAMPVLHDFDHGTDATTAPANTLPDWLKDADFDGDVDVDDFPKDKADKYMPYLKMRATAVYHYGYDDDNQLQTPSPAIACVSNFYDPTNRESARNLQTLADVSGETNNPSGRTAQANSNNGIVYRPPTKTLTNLKTHLENQASLIYPNGRPVNPMLKQALASDTLGRDLTLAEQAAVDAAICAYQIHFGEISPGTSLPTNYELANGAIKEIAFLDGRQIQAVDGGDQDHTDGEFETEYTLSGLYDLPIEQRQPLEIRATVIDLNLLRTKKAGKMRIKDTFTDEIKTDGEDEYMLPNSGIIYASRDDALPDASDVSVQNASNSNPQIAATDFLLDPTRRPHGIMLINGERLGRADGLNASTNDFREVEKGLTLVSNLPVYIQGPFNLHEDENGNPQEEFEEAVTNGNFYDRKTANKNFACRNGDPRLPANSCNNPKDDEWRAANIISDAVTLISPNFRPGFRNEGGYDLRNNRIDNISDPNDDSTDDLTDHAKVEELRRRNGFWNNEFAINGLSSGSIDFARNSIQPGIPAADITPNDVYYSTVGGADDNKVNSTYFNNFVTPVQRRVNYPVYVMEICRKLPVSACTADDWVVGYDSNGNGTLDDDAEKSVKAHELGATSGSNTVNNTVVNRLGAGTTVQPALQPEDQRYARRVAFARNEFGQLIINTGSDDTLRPLGVGCPLDNTGGAPQNNGCSYPNFGQTANNALWFATTENTTGQPWLNTKFRNDQPLAYMEPMNEKEDFLLPDVVPYIESDNSSDQQLIDALKTLNGSNDGNPSDFAVCTSASSDGGKSKDVQVTAISGRCSSAVQTTVTSILNTIDTLASSAPELTIGNQAVEAESDGVTIRKLTTADVGFGGTFDPNTLTDTSTPTATLTLRGDRDSVFVFAPSNNNRPMFFGNVTLDLQGVDPNNVFWVAGTGSDTAMLFSGNNTLSGNFLGSTGSVIGFVPDLSPVAQPVPASQTNIIGGRFLGFGKNVSDLPAAWQPLEDFNVAMGDDDNFWAITSQNQPLLQPVLQLQYITSTPQNNLSNVNARKPDDFINQTQWQPTAGSDANNRTIFNLVAGTGDSPNHPATLSNNDDSDFNGGVANLPRFLENWRPNGQFIDLQIKGSLLQIRRSQYATAPFRPLLEPIWRAKFNKVSNSAGGLFAEERENQEGNANSGGYVQGYGYNNANLANATRIPYYFAPRRDYGFDLGILSQLPDLFSLQFSTPPAGGPNEFFREVSRDDDWVETLLCARLETDPDDYILPEEQRPKACSK